MWWGGGLGAVGGWVGGGVGLSLHVTVGRKVCDEELGAWVNVLPTGERDGLVEEGGEEGHVACAQGHPVQAEVGVQGLDCCCWPPLA